MLFSPSAPSLVRRQAERETQLTPRRPAIRRAPTPIAISEVRTVPLSHDARRQLVSLLAEILLVLDEEAVAIALTRGCPN